MMHWIFTSMYVQTTKFNTSGIYLLVCVSTCLCTLCDCFLQPVTDLVLFHFKCVK